MQPQYKDYYEILGVGRNADAKEIKSAYRKMARKYHPDVNPGDKSAEEKFKDISEAYDVLADDDKREKYNRFGDQWKAYSQTGGPYAGAGFPGGASGYPGGGGFRMDYGSGADSAQFTDLNDLFSSLFGEEGIGGGPHGGGSRFSDRFGGNTRAQPRKGQDVESPITITLEEAFTGTTRNLSLTLPTGPYDMSRGGRRAETTRRVEVKIPAGVAEKQRIRLAGQGAPGPAGPGDLYLIVTIQPHATFERKGDDLYTDVAVPYTSAALGGEAKVPTLKGTRLSMTIPPGTQSGQSFRLGGQGMPRLKGDNGNGDLFARVKITVPKTLSEQERALLTELAALHAA